MRHIIRYALMSVGVLAITLCAWWTHAEFFLPRYHFDDYGDLVSGKTVLVPITPNNRQLTNGIQMPNDSPNIGIVGGSQSGRLYRFNYNGHSYVAYVSSAEMTVPVVYRYARNGSTLVHNTDERSSDVSVWMNLPLR